MKTPFEEAQKRLFETRPPRRTVTLTTTDARGRVVSEDVFVREDTPRFDNSAMDGYAVREQDVVEASPDDPAVLEVVEEIPAGSTEWEEYSLGAGEAMRIFTGAPVPDGADVVLLQEKVDRSGDEIRVPEPPRKGNIRFRGEELKEGEVLVEKGSVVNPATAGILLSQGITEINVFRRPQVGIVSTGEELVDCSETPGPGQIRDSNRPMMETAVSKLASEITSGQIGDDPAETSEVLGEMLDRTDVLMITGGVSVGEHDHVREVLTEHGVEKIFWKVNQKPGKPLFLGRRKETFVFGFPGNPVSALVCFYLFGYPFLRKFAGYSDDEASLRTVRSILDEPREKRRKRPEFARAVTMYNPETEQFESRLLTHQGSHMLSGMSRANSIVRIPVGEDTTAGASLDTYLLPDWS